MAETVDCPKCAAPGQRVGYVSRYAMVDYYRCRRCGEVWTVPKPTGGGDPPRRRDKRRDKGA